MATVTLARNAMATRFEIVLHGENSVSLRAAGEEALDEIDRLEAQLSLFQPASEIAHINARAAREPVRISPPVFQLLQLAMRLSIETEGAFDVTVAPLMRCWGFQQGAGKTPSPEALAEAREKVGFQWVELNEANRTVRFLRPGMMVDLGAIGKGYAVEQAAIILRDAGVESALIHGGTSTVYGLGHDPRGGPWLIDMADALSRSAESAGVAILENTSRFNVGLADRALSVSAVWGKYFMHEGKFLGHVLDPRTGHPVSTAVLAAVALPSATETDALSTALLTLGFAGQESVFRLRSGMRALVAAPEQGKLKILAHGL